VVGDGVDVGHGAPVNNGALQRPQIILSTFAEVREALRAKDLRQALYDDGALVMAGCLLDLHGREHRDRRRLENRLFRRETFEDYETNLMPRAIAEAIDPLTSAGRGDLVQIGYRTVMHLTALVAGIDVAPETADRLEHIVKVFSKGATAVHATGDRSILLAEVGAALDEFDAVFFQPSVACRRQQTGEQHRDVLTTLLDNVDALELPIDVIRREVAFYLQAGGHSTANALTHTLDELWSHGTPSMVQRAREDTAYLQRCVHEALRLHPASPVAWRRSLAPVELRSGLSIDEGTLVVLDIEAANREASVWGPDAAEFDPDRELPNDVHAWGLSFGAGPHACIGMELDGGVPAEEGGSAALYGTVALLAAALLRAGAMPDPEAPPLIDPNSERLHYARYPIVFAPTSS
jgi:cytochrome P450